MASRFRLVPSLKLDELVAYHQDVVASLRLYFSPASPSFIARFAGRSQIEISIELTSRIEESDVRSAFSVLTSLEATFRIDFDIRCRKRLRDHLSVYFRKVERLRGDKIRLDEDILEGWKMYTSAPSSLIGDLRGAFRFRHWLAHGRYWAPKLGRKYDLEYVTLMADSIVLGFPFVS